MDTEIETSLIMSVREQLSDLVAIYLYGSQVTDLTRSESDIDLAVLPAHPLDPVACWNLAQSLAVAVGQDVDLLDLLAASTVMRAQVIATGRCLYCADTYTREQFEIYAFSSYAKLNEERQGILEDICQRGRIHAG